MLIKVKMIQVISLTMVFWEVRAGFYKLSKYIEESLCRRILNNFLVILVPMNTLKYLFLHKYYIVIQDHINSYGTVRISRTILNSCG